MRKGNRLCLWHSLRGALAPRGGAGYKNGGVPPSLSKILPDCSLNGGLFLKGNVRLHGIIYLSNI